MDKKSSHKPPHGSRPPRISGTKPRKEKGVPVRDDGTPFRKQESFKGVHANLFGLHAVREAWGNPARIFKSLYLSASAAKLFEPDLERAREQGLNRPEPRILERVDMDRLLPPGTVHQGIIAETEPLEEFFLQDLVVRCARKERALVVMLDQVTDPHNVGAILRSACVFGADGLIMQTRHAPEVGGIVAKTASGAVEHIPVIYETNLARAIETLQAAGFTALALDERGDVTLDQMPVPAKTLIVMGAEGDGLRPKIKESCNRLVALPTAGPITSLNVSNAAAVTLYALTARGQ